MGTTSLCCGLFVCMFSMVCNARPILPELQNVCSDFLAVEQSLKNHVLLEGPKNCTKCLGGNGAC